MCIKSLFTAAALVGVLASAAPTMAAPAGGDTNSVTVRYGDLDLATPEGARAMLARIHRAAGVVCNDGQDESQDLARRDIMRGCVRHVTADAVASLGSTMVTAMSQGDGRAMLAALAGR